MKRKMSRVLALALALSIAGSTLPASAYTSEPAEPAVAAEEVPTGTKLVLNGLFDVKSLEAGTDKYLYINTYPEEGTAITEVSSDHP
ncbi:hypothetical protein, partial [Flavonifractor hominis]